VVSNAVSGRCRGRLVSMMTTTTMLTTATALLEQHPQALARLLGQHQLLWMALHRALATRGSGPPSLPPSAPVSTMDLLPLLPLVPLATTPMPPAPRRARQAPHLGLRLQGHRRLRRLQLLPRTRPAAALTRLPLQATPLLPTQALLAGLLMAPPPPLGRSRSSSLTQREGRVRH